MPRTASDLRPLRKVCGHAMPVISLRPELDVGSIECTCASTVSSCTLQQACSHVTYIMRLQLLLQEVAWDEDSRGRKRAERAGIVAQCDGIGDLQREPLFCAETALKVLHAFS
jgi:hypothetical protein